MGAPEHSPWRAPHNDLNDSSYQQQFGVPEGTGKDQQEQQPKREQQAGTEPEPKQCSDYVSGQEVFVDEPAGELTKADKRSLDKEGNGFSCDEPGTQWKDTRTHAQGRLPSKSRS